MTASNMRIGIGAPFLTVAILPHRRHLRVIGAK
jgi:hypothetical protein